AHLQGTAEDEWVRRADLFVLEPARRVLGPEPERVRAVGDLDQDRVLAGLARLGDDRVRDLVGVLDQPLLGALENPAAALIAERLPGRLGLPCGRYHRADRLGRRELDLADRRAGRGVLDGDRGHPLSLA